MRVVCLALALFVGAFASCIVEKQLGCYTDQGDGSRALSGYSNEGQDWTPLNYDLCAQQCKDKNFTIAGVEDGHQCFCGDQLNPSAKKSMGCDTPCTASSTEKCGGDYRINAYTFECKGKPSPIPAPLPTPAPIPTPAPSPPPLGLCPDFSRNYCQPGVPLKERIERFMAYMTPADKMNTMSENSIAGKYSDGSKLVARSVGWWQESLHGIRGSCGLKCATQFAEANAMACALNKTLWRATAEAISTEGRALYHAGKLGGLTFFAPQINMAANPLWGRNMECPGEDPHVSSKFAFEYVTGMQGGDPSGILKTVTTPKHFMGQIFEGDSSDPWGNGTTVNRQDNDTRYSLHDLEAYYLVARPAFKSAMVDAGAGSVMCAYQGVNGVPMCANGFILNRVVREWWGWEGFVVSDCDAIKTMMVRNEPGGNPSFGHAYSLTGAMAVQDGVRAGCDSNCGDPYRQSGAEAMAAGLVTEMELNASVRRLLRPMFQLGLFDPPEQQPYTHLNWSHVGTDAHKQLALEGARQSLVLLQNPPAPAGDTAILPLKKGAKVLLAGPLVDARRIMLGNYNGDACHGGGDMNCMVPLSQWVASVNSGGTVNKVMGPQDPCKNDTDALSHIANVTDALKNGGAFDAVVLAFGGDCHEGEGSDRPFLGLPGTQQVLFDAVAKAAPAGTPIVVLLVNGGVLAIDTIKANPRTAVIEAFYPGQEGSQALAEALFGDINPGGKLTVTVYPAAYAHGELVSGTPWMDAQVRPHKWMDGGPLTEGRSHMYYTGTPLYPFGFGLSYTSFELAWGSDMPPQPRIFALSSVAEVLPHVYTVYVTNTGKVAGKEVVFGFWSPPKEVDPFLNRQTFAFGSAFLQPGETRAVKLELPSAVTLATVTEGGDRVFFPGAYRLTFSRGHGRALTTQVVVEPDVTNATTATATATTTAAPGAGAATDDLAALVALLPARSGPNLTLSRFPSPWVDGHGVTVDACVEGTTDVVPHTEEFLLAYKRWDWGGATGGNPSQIVHRASGLCLSYNTSDSAAASVLTAVYLSGCSAATAGSESGRGSPSALVQLWVYDTQSKQVHPHLKHLGESGASAASNNPCLVTAAVNTSMLRVNVTLADPARCAAPSRSAAWQYDPETGFIQSGLAGSPPLCLVARNEGIFNTGS